MRRSLILVVALAVVVGCAPAPPRADVVMVDRLAFGVGLDRTDSLIAALVKSECKTAGPDCNEAKRARRAWRVTYEAGVRALTAPAPKDEPRTFDLGPLLEMLAPFVKFAIDAAL